MTGATPELLRDGPPAAPLGVVLAHGAGAGMESPFLARVARELAAAGHAVFRFEFPYMAARRQGARKPPDRRPVLEGAFRDAVAATGRPPATLVLAGKSLGARIASHVADDLGARALLCLGYPFHPPGRDATGRVEHLAALRTPARIVQGTRDPFGTAADIAGYALSPAIELRWIEGGDHAFALPAAERRRGRDGVAEAIAAALEFLAAP